MYFTQEDFKKIQEWLKRNSVKDTEFPLASPENGTEQITFVQNGTNVKLALNDFKQMVGGSVSTITPPKITNSNNTITITAPMYDKIYYTLGTKYYPELNEEGLPVNSDITKEYINPIPYKTDTLVRAIVMYKTAEGNVLKSSVTEYKAVYEVSYTEPSITINNNTVSIINPNVDSEIYYTIDNSTPTINSNKYEGPFNITETVTLKVVTIFSNGYSSPIKEKLLEFTKRVVQTPTSKSFTFNGNEQTAYTDGSDYTVSGTVKAVNSGNYTAIFTLRNPNTTKWSTTDSNTVTVSWVINKKQTTITWNVPSGNFGSKEVGTEITFNASVDNGEVKFYRNGTSVIQSPYTLLDSDKGTLTSIVAKNTLNDTTNYKQASDVTKTITVTEKAIPYEYGFISIETLSEIASKYNDDMNQITVEDIKEKTTLNELKADKETITATEDATVLAYPRNKSMKALESGTTNEYTVVGNNLSADVNIKLYLIGSGTSIDFVK